MPELPEVEVSRLGISPFLTGKTVKAVHIHHPQLRWPVPSEVKSIVGVPIINVHRRAKYLLLETERGTVVLHLGMSGKLRVLPEGTPLVKHDHIEIITQDGQSLRLNDPRRFGACLFQAPEEELDMLAKLGPEPLSEAFEKDLLFRLSRGKTSPVKTFIMDNHVVVGVGNIYANEALFMSGIDPRRPAGKISKARYVKLHHAIQTVLARAIEQGGTTLKDFSRADGQPGYFAIELQVYGRGGEPCVQCDKTLKETRIGQRSSVFCTSCQR
ncbi:MULTISPECIES: bifunctional DNA-formamidopyrimidine glycosylase/DNA-(apurinic or apyrimidinic site) lyase [Gammaproteobacteria]|uniref:bifunctional DNA-formamidopyrimidine glycosylase/DNA-(apurinic or apyrimidinic site) lyase n=1 Tax=Gammaproteobacteria TaxID=1236 RepID=UPI000DD0D3BB|nr:MULTISPECIES: bifunctional DNA-formamidopyrimidine glycosylase/DNA-(apurinic or apyrimidinic site) lyase [Gammaproteobacteria]RTE86493.1 bifunctional DNA-formamidopyrimidine glycosylase/DNA-(apurinic or apyrimidinic site) lyase [Aliidiomarina sp. B3213]TCZ90952.1 bifunctional DNA-formamidopyrimidine glycosylase/DNA-(apurinic or apyrimidinic site) lyase [Lysobacter sp. N42]